MDWFSAFHAGYRDLEFAVLFFSPYVVDGESAGGAVFWDCGGIKVFSVVCMFFGLVDWFCGGLWLAFHLCWEVISFILI